MSFKRETPLDLVFHRASIKGDKETIIKVLNSGRVHIDCRDVDGTTPLMLAVCCSNFDCVQELLEQGADPNAQRFETWSSPLFLGSQNGDLEIVRLLLQNGAKVNQPNFDGGTPLFVACQFGHESVVRELLASGAITDLPMKDKATPLFVASQNGHCIIVRLLLEKKAFVDAKRTDLATPLWISCQMGWADVCSCLIQHGAFIDSIRNDGVTPLLKAANKGFVDVVRVLLRKKPNLGLLPVGMSALHGAVLGGHMNVIKMLLKVGSNPYLCNQDGETPYELSVIYKYPHISDYLNSYVLAKNKPS